MVSQKWKVGKYPSVVVSDTKIQNTNFPLSDPENDYYGGFLVCESVGNERIAQLISVAPQLLKCLKEAIETVELERNKAPREWHEIVAIAEGIKS